VKRDLLPFPPCNANSSGTPINSACRLADAALSDQFFLFWQVLRKDETDVEA